MDLSIYGSIYSNYLSTYGSFDLSFNRLINTVHPSIFIDPSVYGLNDPSVYLWIDWSVSLTIDGLITAVCLAIDCSICLSINLWIYLFTDLFIYLFVCYLSHILCRNKHRHMTARCSGTWEYGGLRCNSATWLQLIGEGLPLAVQTQLVQLAWLNFPPFLRRLFFSVFSSLIGTQRD